MNKQRAERVDPAVPPTSALTSRCRSSKALLITTALINILFFTHNTFAQTPVATPHPYRPFLDPVNIRDSWFLLLIPMAFLMSLAYKAVRCHDMRRYWRAVLAMTLQVIFGMIALGAGFYVLIEYVLPRVVP